MALINVYRVGVGSLPDDLLLRNSPGPSLGPQLWDTRWIEAAAQHPTPATIILLCAALTREGIRKLKKVV
jgi:hypothetical protein